VTSEWQIDIVRSRAPVIGAAPHSSYASDRLHRIRVARPQGDPLGITAAEHLRAGQVGGESVTYGLTRHWETERYPFGSG